MIQNIAQFIIGIFKFHKKKIFLVIASAVLFFVMLFPYGDLSDLISSKVAEITNNRVYLTFEDIGLSFFPTISAKLQNVSIETPRLPPIKASSLMAAPSIPALLTFNLGLTTKAEGFLNGEVSVTVKQSKTKEKKIPNFTFSVDAEDLSSGKLIEFLKLSTPAKGNIDLELEGSVEPTMAEQPEVEFNIQSEKGITIDDSNIPTLFGPLPFPKMTFSSILLRGRLINSDLILEEVTLGSPKDNLSAKLKGNLFLKFNKVGATIQPMMGRYSLSTRLIVKNSAKKSFELFLGFLDKYEKRAVGSSTYMFKAEGANFAAPPRMTPLTKL